MEWKGPRLRKDDFDRVIYAQHVLNNFVFPATGGQEYDGVSYCDVVLMYERRDVVNALKTLIEFVNIKKEELYNEDKEG